MEHYQSLNHSKWECKYHVVFIPKYRRKALYFELRRHLGGIFRALTEQKESAVEEGTPDVRSRAHAAVDSTEVRGRVGGRVHQGEERHPHRANVHGAEAQLRRAALLGARLLCLDRRSRRGGDPAVHPRAGGRGQTRRSAQPGVAPATFRWLLRPLVSGPHSSRFERLTDETPRLCRGMR
jgi:Transposase IS200 like